MDTGQIMQGMSLRQMQQAAAQQGINMGQLMQQGVSFADIMLMIISNMQNGQNMQNAQGMPLMQGAQTQDMQGQVMTEAQDTRDGQLGGELLENGFFGMQQAADGAVFAEENEADTSDNNGSSVRTADHPDTDDADEPVKAAETYADAGKAVQAAEDIGEAKLSDFEQGIMKAAEETAPKDIEAARTALDFMRNQMLNGSDALSQQFASNYASLIPDSAPKMTEDMGIRGFADGQKFVLDLLSSISKDDMKDSFDLPDSIIKADPMQLAGLLNFIQTGTGIPSVYDSQQSGLFENISASAEPSGRVVFDPEEMIKSGEMEIVSYTPAAKHSPQSDERQDLGHNDENAMNFARTMKSVRENVKPVKADRDFDMNISDEDEVHTQSAAAAAAADLEKTAERVDISFDRAYAELEMNKAKYGTPDEQVARSVAKNLAEGRSEFTVKLRPEGLGEILVKLVSDNKGKTVLSMMASSARTADLLNRDLASLQSSLGAKNVEIEHNEVRTAETVNPTQQTFSQFDQRRQDEGQQQNQFRQLRQQIRHDDITVGDVSEYEETPVSAAVGDSALDITI